MMIFLIKVNEFIEKTDKNGTTKLSKKTPLILKKIFRLKIVLNYESMAWKDKSDEDGLGSLCTLTSRTSAPILFVQYQIIFLVIWL